MPVEMFGNQRCVKGDICFQDREKGRPQGRVVEDRPIGDMQDLTAIVFIKVKPLQIVRSQGPKPSCR